MLEQMQRRLRQHGMNFKTEAITVMTTDEKDNGKFTFDDQGRNKELEKVHEMKILGINIPKKADTIIMLGERMEKATKAFWSDKHIYTCRSINLRKRLHLFQTRILPILLYGCEIWILTPKVMKTMETWLK